MCDHIDNLPLPFGVNLQLIVGFILQFPCNSVEVNASNVRFSLATFLEAPACCATTALVLKVFIVGLRFTDPMKAARRTNLSTRNRLHFWRAYLQYNKVDVCTSQPYQAKSITLWKPLQELITAVTLVKFISRQLYSPWHCCQPPEIKSRACNTKTLLKAGFCSSQTH